VTILRTSSECGVLRALPPFPPRRSSALRLIIILILLRGVTLGLETWPQVLAEHGRPLHALDRTLLWIFVAEIGLRLYAYRRDFRSEEHTSELPSRENLVCRLPLEKKKAI